MQNVLLIGTGSRTAGRNVPVAVSLNGGADKSIPYDEAFVYEKDLAELLKIYPSEGPM